MQNTRWHGATLSFQKYVIDEGLEEEFVVWTFHCSTCHEGYEDATEERCFGQSYTVEGLDELVAQHMNNYHYPLRGGK